MAVKVLAVGSGADVSALVKKVKSVNAKNGPFEVILIAGDSGFTTETELGADPFPAPAYFSSQSFDSSERKRTFGQNNLTYVGEAWADVVSGLKVVFIAGGYDDPPANFSEPRDYPFPPQVKAAVQSAGALGMGYQGIDILITGDWPRTRALSEDNSVSGSLLVSAAASLLRPRYHVCGGGEKQYRQMGPFVIPGASHGTRLVTLGSSGARAGAKKERWMYAAGVTPLAGMAKDQMETGAAGPCPYVLGKDNNGRFRDIDEAEKLELEERKRAAIAQLDGNRPRRPRFAGHPTDAKCWFCLGNEKDLHLVVSVGKEVYVALAKGALTQYHVLLVPIEHLRSSYDMSQEATDELDKFKEALREMFGSCLDSDALFFERVLQPRGGQLHSHTQVQVVPVPRNTSSEASVKLGEEAQRAKIKLEQLPKGESFQSYIKSNCADSSPEYFFAELPDGRTAIQMISNDRKASDTDDSRPVHPMQFGRRYAASLLGMPQRVDWKRCTKSVGEETQDADKFRSEFALFDPTIEKS